MNHLHDAWRSLDQSVIRIVFFIDGLVKLAALSAKDVGQRCRDSLEAEIEFGRLNRLDWSARDAAFGHGHAGRHRRIAQAEERSNEQSRERSDAQIDVDRLQGQQQTNRKCQAAQKEADKEIDWLEEEIDGRDDGRHNCPDELQHKGHYDA